MKKLKLLLKMALISFLGACSAGQQGVLYSEMSENPKLSLENGKLIVQIKNSKIHSALAIFKIDAKIDEETKELNLYGFQKLVDKEIKEHFEIELSENIVNNIGDWTIYWVDPDGKKTKINEVK